MRMLATLALTIAVTLAIAAAPDRDAGATRSITTVLVFTTASCAVCDELNPILDRAAAATQGRVRLVRVDVDRHPDIAERYGIRAIPTVLALRHGEPTYWFIGEATDLEVILFIDHITNS